jgi:sn-glycerol 3-phosphate transport system substrate-binding protein
VVAFLVITGLGVAACSDPPSAGDQEAADDDDGGALPECDLAAFDEAVADGPVEIELWFGGLVGSAQQAMVDMAAAFNEDQDDVVLTAHDQGTAYEEVYRSFDSASAAGADQLPDAVYLQAEDFASTIDSGRVLPAQACMEAADYDPTNIEPIARSYYTHDGVLQAAYMNTSNPVLYYNATHFNQAGLDPQEPPTTLEELRETAQTLQDEGVSERPLVLKLDRWPFAVWLSAIGVDVVDNNNGRSDAPSEATFDVEETRELFDFFRQMNDDGLIQVVPNEEGSIDQYLPLADPESPATMLVETSTAATSLRDILAGDLDAADIGTDVLAEEDTVPMAAELPGIEAPGQIYPTGGGFYIMNTSTPVEQVASWKFMEYMLDPEHAVDWLTAGGYVPSVKAVLDDPEVQDYLENDVAGLMTAPAISQMRSADPDKPGPAMGPYIDFTEEFQGALEGVFLTGEDIDSALETAEENVTSALDRYYG